LVYITRLHYNARFKNTKNYRTLLSLLYGIGKHFVVFSAPIASNNMGFSTAFPHYQGRLKQQGEFGCSLGRQNFGGK